MQMKTAMITIAVLAVTMLMSANTFAEARPSNEFEAFDDDFEGTLSEFAERDLLDDDDEELEPSERAFEDDDDESEFELRRALAVPNKQPGGPNKKPDPTKEKACRTQCDKLHKQHKKPAGNAKEHKKPEHKGEHKGKHHQCMKKCLTGARPQ